MHKVAILQSNYIPWKGYFDIIHEVDTFVFYDDVQYTRRDWRNRNKVKTPKGADWLTVPVKKGAREQLIHEVEIEETDWQKNHWRTLQCHYSKAHFFNQYSDFLQALYLEQTWCNLSEFNHHVIKQISEHILNIQTTFVDDRKFGATERNQGRLLQILKELDADYYLSGPAAKAYIDEDEFRKAGVEIEWKSYSGYPEYSQFYPPFEHGVTILDLIMHVGPEAPWYIWGWRDEHK
jgi:hypothetical protein